MPLKCVKNEKKRVKNNSVKKFGKKCVQNNRVKMTLKCIKK